MLASWKVEAGKGCKKTRQTHLYIEKGVGICLNSIIYGPASVVPLPPPVQVWSVDLTPRPPLWWWKGAYLLITAFAYLVT